jgi:hypothetical protein
MSARTDRNERLFGAEGQLAISETRITIVGLGGLGSHVAQQLAYLGVANYRLVDNDLVGESSLNRLVGGVPGDASQHCAKVDVAERNIRAIQPSAIVQTFPALLQDPRAALAFEGADFIVGCLDNDLSRLRLTEIAMRIRVPYLDLASDIDPVVPSYGGRVFLAIPGIRCLSCVGVLDQAQLRRAAMTYEEGRADDRIYGVSRRALDGSGPAVVSVNGVVASLAVTEFMVWATRLRNPYAYLIYLGHLGTVRRNTDEPSTTCLYCGRAARTPSG